MLFVSAEYDNSLRVNLDNLLIQLKPYVTPKWYEFGEAVGIEKEVLDKFAEQCSPEDCIIEMLDYWLRQCKQQPTWNDVANILKIINLQQLAVGIESVYKTGNNNHYIYICTPINLVGTNIIYHMYSHAGKFPVEVKMDCNWIPQLQETLDSDSVELPPPIPPKMLESAAKSYINNMSQNFAPALPPKPIVAASTHNMFVTLRVLDLHAINHFFKCRNDIVTDIPPRPPK